MVPPYGLRFTGWNMGIIKTSDGLFEVLTDAPNVSDGVTKPRRASAQ